MIEVLGGGKKNEMLLIVGYSITSENKNIVRNHLSYGPATISKDQVLRFQDLNDFALQHLQRSMTIREALELLRTRDSFYN